MKIGLVTDSTCDLAQEIVNKYNIEIVPLSIHFGDEIVYKDRVDIQSEDFFRKLVKAEKLPTTSQPSIGLFVEKYRDLAPKYDVLITIHLSSKLSGTFEAARMAANELSDIKVIPVDSHSVSLGLGFLVIQAAEYIAAGMEVDEIVSRIEEARNMISIYFSVNDLSYLQKGGRIGKAQAFLGSVLNFYPILSLPGESGEILPFEKIRGKKKIVKRMVEIVKNELTDEKTVSIGLLYATEELDNFSNFVQGIQEHLREKNDLKYSINKSILSSVLGCHVGPSVYGIVILKGTSFNYEKGNTQ
jgi:DegV family protein with EDD domain